MFQRSIKNTQIHILINKHKGKLHITKKLEWSKILYLQQVGRTCPSEGKVELFFLLIHPEEQQACLVKSTSEHAQLCTLLSALSLR